MDWAKLIDNQGFPIVCVIALAWYVVYLSKNFKAELKDVRQNFTNELKEFRETLKGVQDAHAEESKQTVEALNNNTVALQRLSDKLDQVKGDIKNES